MGLDDFFTGLEVRKSPELKEKPLIVSAGPKDSERRGVVFAASPEARRMGVRAGMEMRKAHKLCPGAVTLPASPLYYESESEKFMEILRWFSPLVESFGPGEAFVEIEGGQSQTQCNGEPLFEKGIALANEMKERVKQDLGLGSSAGVAPNKLLAKLAADFKSPGGLFIVRKNDAAKFLNSLPLKKLPSLGPGMEARLRSLGIKSIRDLSKAQPLFLEKLFGPRSKVLHEQSLGKDTSPVVPFHEPGSITREAVFVQPTGDLSLIRETLYGLTENVTSLLKGSGGKCGAVAVKIGESSFKTLVKSGDLDLETDSMNDIWGAANALLEEAEFSGKVRLVGVKVSRFYDDA
ncbi:MAG: DNA polymerase IV [Thermodesulfobacteriota bacterium]|nr:MAG: DNA polymerase IV [Thermodesulfobacteriota bacterium]